MPLPALHNRSGNCFAGEARGRPGALPEKFLQIALNLCKMRVQMALDRTLSMMEYEDWRPKLGPMSPAELWYAQMLANSTPRYTPEQLRPMTTEELSRW